MKRFVKKVLLYFAFCMMVSVIPSYLIDPYNVFHWKNIRNNGVDPNKNYINTKYILNNPDKFDGFIFGSSRVGAIHVEKITDIKIYNMWYAAGTPNENYQTLKTFIDGGVNINVVYVGLDSLSYTENPESHNSQYLRAQYQYLKNAENIFDMYLLRPSIVLSSLKTISKGYDIDGFDTFYEYGWWCDYNQKKRNVTYQKFSDTMTEVPDLVFQDIQNIKNLCDENGIKVVFFTNPLYISTYEKDVMYNNYFAFLERLADITDFYNFSSINNISCNGNNYIDYSHPNAYVGDIQIDAIFNDTVDSELYEQGFGWYVTKDNIDELLNLLREQMSQFSPDQLQH